MNIEILNRALSDINSLRSGKDEFNLIMKTESSDGSYDGEGSLGQGQYNEIVEVYNLNDDCYVLKLVLHTDSYNDNEAIQSISITKGKTKEILVYE